MPVVRDRRKLLVDGLQVTKLHLDRLSGIDQVTELDGFDIVELIGRDDTFALVTDVDQDFLGLRVRELKSLREHAGAISCVAFSSDSKKLASCGADGKVSADGPVTLTFTPVAGHMYEAWAMAGHGPCRVDFERWSRAQFIAGALPLIVAAGVTRPNVPDVPGIEATLLHLHDRLFDADA